MRTLPCIKLSIVISIIITCNLTYTRSSLSFQERYPHLSDDQSQTLNDINASPEQWKASDASAKKTLDRFLANYRHDTGKPLVVLVTGATGAGKSATANTLLGRKAFEEGSAAVSVTTQVQWEDSEYDGMSITVIDTPGSWETEVITKWSQFLY